MIRLHRCSTCGKRTLTFSGLMRHYLRSHRTAAVDGWTFVGGSSLLTDDSDNA